MSECSQEYSFLLSSGNSVICASGDNLQSVYRGDSGGPLVTADTRKLVGIASFVHYIKFEINF